MRRPPFRPSFALDYRPPASERDALRTKTGRRRETGAHFCSPPLISPWCRCPSSTRSFHRGPPRWTPHPLVSKRDGSWTKIGRKRGRNIIFFHPTQTLLRLSFSFFYPFVSSWTPPPPPCARERRLTGENPLNEGDEYNFVFHPTLISLWLSLSFFHTFVPSRTSSSAPFIPHSPWSGGSSPPSPDRSIATLRVRFDSHRLGVRHEWARVCV